ncbi:MDR family MFS transporter [Naumannella halotolerans]|uniref:EmrB/QacA subfamily drug resistance transporter n=1 Tax=Naumannella halotolerans TaxID=993414 RepID=A0A4R7J1X1_9ACTN|nr:MDR family MFS transporter [Naumannella halotolerans]TDT31161.1 EmrB/QacA subfamily drug resistance transporter [Naumannella halotolerans]
MSNERPWPSATTDNHNQPDGDPTPVTTAPPGGDAPAEPLSHNEILKVMTGLLGVLFTAMLATTIVSTALPTIMADLNGTQRQYTWVITASLLAMTVSTPIWGKLSDVFSKKLLVQLSILLFVLGSIGAGLSTAIAPLMIFRAVQGLAMGGLTALTQSIMGSIISPRDRGRYSGYMAAVMTVSTVAGPVIGGVITDTLGWRWCFLIVVPIAVAASILLQRTLQLEHHPRKVHFDYAGALLFTIAAALPMLWVTFAGEDYAWLSWQTLAFAVGFGVAAGLAVFVELRSPEPIVPLRVLANRTSILMIVAGMGAGVSMFASGVFMTQFFQLAGGYEPTIAGLMTIPLIIAQMLSTTIGGQIVSRTGRWKPLMIGGSVLLVIGLFMLGTVDHTTPYAFVAISMFVMGLGIGTMVQNTVLAVQNSVALKDVGSASATVSFFRSLGGAVGVSALGAVLASQVQGHVSTSLVQAGVDPSVLGSSGGNLDIGALPAAVQTIVHQAYGDSFGLLFQIAGVISVVVLAAVIFAKETRLRSTIDLPEEPKVDLQA